MNAELYIFGSAVRGEIDASSDLDVLAVPATGITASYPEGWSIYQRSTLKRYFEEGRLFAWHLHLESVCVYKPTKESYIEGLGRPALYKDGVQDFENFNAMYCDAVAAIRAGTSSIIFETGLIYTCLRDLAMAASWHLLHRPDFSRYSPFHLPTPIPLSRAAYETAIASRHWSNRGCPRTMLLSQEDIKQLCSEKIREWIAATRETL